MNPVAQARRNAEKQYRRFDPDTDVARGRSSPELWRRVKTLTRAGHTAQTVATMCGIQRRSVERIKNYEVPPPPPRLEFDLSEERAAVLESAADSMLELAWLLRDEDPTKVWEALSHLGRHHLQELTMIALTAVDPGLTKVELLGWVQ